MDIEESLQSDMKTVTAISTLVSGRIYLYEADAAAKTPNIVIDNPSNVRNYVTQTRWGGAARLSVYCYGRTEATARAVGQAVISEYRETHRTVGDQSVYRVEVSDARFLLGPGVYRYLVDMIMTYS